MLSWLRLQKPNWKEIRIAVAPFFAVWLILLLIGFEVGIIDGPSMEPTTKSGDITISIDAWNIKTNDVVVFLAPEVWELKGEPKKERMLIKRVHHFSEDGSKVWLLGDNADNSLDSRFFDYVPRSDVYSKVLLIIHRK